MTAWSLAPGEEQPINLDRRRGAGSLTAAQVADRCGLLGARVERGDGKYRIYPPDRTRPPVFISDRFTNGRDRPNAIAALRRAGLDVTADPQPQEIPDMPTPADVAPRNGAKQPTPNASAVAELRQQMQTMLEMLAEAEARDAKLTVRIDELESRLAATPGAPPARDPHADLDDAIVALLVATPIKLPAGVVAVNLPEPVEVALVADRLALLAKAGRVVDESSERQGRVYRAASA